MSASSGRPCLKPKLSTASWSCVAGAIVERRHEAVLELVHVEGRRVDDEIGGVTGTAEQGPFLLDRLEQAGRLRGQRVAAAGGVVSAHELGRRGIQEQHSDTVTLAAQGGDTVEHAAIVAPGDQCEAVDAAARHRGEVDDLLDEGGRKVVDDIPPEVLENIGGG